MPKENKSVPMELRALEEICVQTGEHAQRPARRFIEQNSVNCPYMSAKDWIAVKNGGMLIA